MILILHHQSKKLSEVRFGDKKIAWEITDMCQSLWELSERYPNELIYWCAQEFLEILNIDELEKIFQNDLVMASYAYSNCGIPDNIGYIDQLPFINVNRNVKYGTWRMSTDAGGIKASTLLKFKKHFQEIQEFDLLLDSIAKLGQYNGLLCYSDPRFFKTTLNKPATLRSHASTSQFFSFVYKYYKTERLWLLLFCYLKYEGSFPLFPFLRSFTSKKSFLKEIDLSEINIGTRGSGSSINSIDVIIPTLRRREYLLQVLDDLKNQTLLPKKVIIVEQNPEPDSCSELPELEKNFWPFEIIHHFTHKTGACSARNMALAEVSSDSVFFADDDNRMENNVLKNAVNEMQTFGIQCLTLNYMQEGEVLFFDKRKQWGTFGAGNSIVLSKYAEQIRFDTSFDHGYGEDTEYGMQLRHSGCDIIYHPEIKILHLKAPRGGFRETTLPPWSEDQPKPAPTVLLYARKYFTKIQMRGFKTELFLRNYDFKKNPVSYWRNMTKRWKVSQKWADKLSRK